MCGNLYDDTRLELGIIYMRRYRRQGKQGLRNIAAPAGMYVISCIQTSAVCHADTVKIPGMHSITDDLQLGH